jgi:hypothetical protein
VAAPGAGAGAGFAIREDTAVLGGAREAFAIREDTAVLGEAGAPAEPAARDGAAPKRKGLSVRAEAAEVPPPPPSPPVQRGHVSSIPPY